MNASWIKSLCSWLRRPYAVWSCPDRVIDNSVYVRNRLRQGVLSAGPVPKPARAGVTPAGRSEASYQRLFERHPQPMWVFDPRSLRFVAVNDAAVATYGYSHEEFLAMTIADIRPAEDRPALEEALRNASRQFVSAGVWRHRKKDGSLIDVKVTSNAIEFEERDSRLVLAEDITAQSRLEEQLRQAQKMEAVGNLAGGI